MYAGMGGGGIAIAVLLSLLSRRWARRERPLRARDVFRMPQRVDGFTVVRLLQAMDNSPLVQLSDSRRDELRREIAQVQSRCFHDPDRTVPETELRELVQRWLKIAC